MLVLILLVCVPGLVLILLVCVLGLVLILLMHASTDTAELCLRNGSVLDGLLLWKQNIDKRFQGVEECNICFYVLHGTNYQLPKLACRNCKKRFHPACLYKWFSTSSKSTCPMCRQLF